MRHLIAGESWPDPSEIYELINCKVLTNELQNVGGDEPFVMYWML